MRTPGFEKRHRASAVVSAMLIECMLCLREGFSRASIIDTFPGWMVAAVIRVNDDKGDPPATKSFIAKILDTSYQNVGNWLDQLEGQHVVKASGNGFIGDDSFLEARIDAPFFKRIVRAIIKAGKLLEDLYGDDI